MLSSSVIIITSLSYLPEPDCSKRDSGLIGAVELMLNKLILAKNKQMKFKQEALAIG
jgi:hypothetical protein